MVLIVAGQAGDGRFVLCRGTPDRPGGGHYHGLEAESARNQLKTKRLDFGVGLPGVLRFKPPSDVTKDLAETRAMSLPFDTGKINAKRTR
jgi:hypothetical protein